MRASYRVVANTGAQYVRTIINMLLSLYTVRLVLQSLGENDYGIYNLIAGVVAMLAFVTNSMVTTTQRYISFYYGKGEKNKVKEYFNSSVILHLLIGIGLALVLELLCPFLFNGFLNIPDSRIHASVIVYQTVIIVLFLSFITAPYRALLISHENIVYISIIDIIDGVLKVVLVILLTTISFDKLVFYGWIMVFVQSFNFLALSLFSFIKYEECIVPSFKKIKKSAIKELTSFAGWNVYSTCCFVARQQGIAIVLNKMMGTAIIAAYGIGFQVAGYTNFLSQAILNAIQPQIVKAEGKGDRAEATWLSFVTSKFMFFLLAIVCIPCMFEIDGILSWWLGNVPQYSGLFCIMVMLTLLVDSLSVGLNQLNLAIGNIGRYLFLINTPKLLTLPFAYVLLKMGSPIYSVAICYVGIELTCSLVRLPLLYSQIKIDIRKFVNDVLLMEILPLLSILFTCFIITNLFCFKYRFILTFCVSAIVFSSTIYLFGLSKREKSIISNLIHVFIEKIFVSKK